MPNGSGVFCLQKNSKVIQFIVRSTSNICWVVTQLSVPPNSSDIPEIPTKTKSSIPVTTHIPQKQEILVQRTQGLHSLSLCMGLLPSPPHLTSNTEQGCQALLQSKKMLTLTRWPHHSHYDLRQTVIIKRGIEKYLQPERVLRNVEES